MFKRLGEIAAAFAFVLTALLLFGLFSRSQPEPEPHAAQASEVLTNAVYNKTLTLADTEYSQALPAGCRYFSIKPRAGTTATVRVAFVTGKVATPTAPYLTLGAGQWLSSPEKYAASADTVYLASSTTLVEVEIVAYY